MSSDLPWYRCKKCKAVRQVPNSRNALLKEDMTLHELELWEANLPKTLWCKKCKTSRYVPNNNTAYLSPGWLKCAAPKEHTVERIVDHRHVLGRIDEYLVKWKDYPSSRNTWEPECNLNPSALEDALDLKKEERRLLERDLPLLSLHDLLETLLQLLVA